MKRETSRKEIFEKEVKTGATIQDIKIYTNSLELIFKVDNGYNWKTGKKGWFLTETEHESLKAEIKDLKQKIRIYEKKIQAIERQLNK